MISVFFAINFSILEIIGNYLSIIVCYLQLSFIAFSSRYRTQLTSSANKSTPLFNLNLIALFLKLNFSANTIADRKFTFSTPLLKFFTVSELKQISPCRFPI